MQAEHPTIGFIGGGNMAQAMLRGLLAAGHPASRLLVADPQPEQRTRLGGLAAGLAVHADNAPVAAAADVLVLAVKPQLIDGVMQALAAGARPAGQLVFSVAAGISLARLADQLGPVPLVRVMPNQPALVGAGVSVMAASAGVTADQRALATRLARSMGEAIWIEDESLMDAVTAVSGSGPAYFYLLMEAIEAAGVELGLPQPLARRLTLATAAGAGRAALELGLPPEGLRASVTSPGGTTAAAIGVMEEGNLRGLVATALRAARDRSVSLSQPPAGS